MITGTPGLAAWMATANKAQRFDLWTLITRAGVVSRWTDRDVSVLTADGRLFTPGPLMARSRIKLTAGLEVDQLNVTVHCGGAAPLVGGTPLLHLARQGGLDGATVLLEWAYFDVDNILQGTCVKFPGTVGKIDGEAGELVLQVRSELARLARPVPGEVYQAACLNTVYDARCAVNRATFTVAGTVSAVGSGFNPVISVTMASVQPAGQFNLGVLKFTSGANNGNTRTVQTHAQTGTAATFTVALPFPGLVQVGDTVAATAGCDRALATCEGKFNNRARFRGTPFIPVPETVA